MGPFLGDFGAQVEAKLGHVGHQVGLKLPFWSLVAPKKKRSENKMQKVSKNGYTGHARKTVPGAVGPLKDKKIRLQIAKQ